MAIDPKDLEIGEVVVDRERGTIKIGEYTVDLALFMIMVKPNPRVLWSFSEEDGRISAQGYSEDEVIWLQPSDMPGKGS